MNVCIIGEGLTSLALAKNLINKKINVHIYYKTKIQKKITSRTIGISKNNLEFFKKEIFEITKINYWKIKKIEIYSQKVKNENIFNFNNEKDDLFYMVKNERLYELLKKEVLESKFIKRIAIDKKLNEKNLNKKNYDLIINSDPNNFIAKKYFTKKIEKNYFNLAYTAIFKHKKIENNTAVQVFTEFGPIAFLPISSNETSVVCSLDTKSKRFSNSEIIELINKNNPKYSINKIFGINSFKLSSSILRNYYQKNILAFGDLLHRIHPLAGQGFNMVIRDIKILSEIIQNKIDLGLQLDISILRDFENQAKNKNFMFSNGIDFIYEFFSLEKKLKIKNLTKILKIVGKNKNFNNLLIKIADRGINL